MGQNKRRLFKQANKSDKEKARTQGPKQAGTGLRYNRDRGKRDMKHMAFPILAFNWNSPEPKCCLAYI